MENFEKNFSYKLIRLIFYGFTKIIGLFNIMEVIYYRTNSPDHEIITIYKRKLRFEEKYHWILNLSSDVAKLLIKKSEIEINSEICKIKIFVHFKCCYAS